MPNFISEGLSRAAGAVEGVANAAASAADKAMSAVGLGSSIYYPPPAFHFSVKVLGGVGALSMLTQVDSSFAEVSGLNVTWDTETVIEGGENRFVHRLPTQPKYANATLKRGVVTGSSAFGEWVTQSIGAKLNYAVVPQHVLISLKGNGAVPLVCWLLHNAYPVRSDTATMNSTSNEVLMETVELSYQYFDRFTPHSLASIAATVARIGLAASGG